MYCPIKDVINAAPLCFQENVELNAYDEETASKEKLSKAASKVLGSATAVLTMLVDLLTFSSCWHLWLEGLFFWWAPVWRRSAQRSTGCSRERIFIFIRRLIKSSTGGLVSLLGKQQKSCALGCIITGIAHRQVWVIWVIILIIWRMKMGADALSQNVLFHPGCSLNFPLKGRKKQLELLCLSFCHHVLVSCLVETKKGRCPAARSDVTGSPWRSRFSTSDTKSLALLQPPLEALKAAAVVNRSRQAC